PSATSDRSRPRASCRGKVSHSIAHAGVRTAAAGIFDCLAKQNQPQGINHRGHGVVQRAQRKRKEKRVGAIYCSGQSLSVLSVLSVSSVVNLLALSRW